MGEPLKAIVNGRVRQSVCRWCFEKMPLEELARHAAEMGLAAIDLVEPRDFSVLKRHGLIGSMTPSHTIEKGLNNPAHHAECLERIRDAIEATAAAGFQNVICFSGNREPGISDDAGADHCVAALRQIAGYAERNRVTIHMELLNSKVDHPGYMCDRSAWAVRVAEGVASPAFKLLYDIYHMQVQEGDVIATIRKLSRWIGHYHTAGVPGRHELDATQELNYPAVVRAIVETGYTGFLAHEFLPAREPMASLRAAVTLCDV